MKKSFSYFVLVLTVLFCNFFSSYISFNSDYQFAIAPVVIAAIIAAVAAIGAAGVNYYQQKKNLNYQKSMQQEAWRREDTATARRIQDLKKSGLSPTLAAGSAATTSSPVSTAPAQLDLSNSANIAMQAVQMDKNFESIDKQMEVADSQKALNAAKIFESNSNTFKNQADTATKLNDLDIARKSGGRTHPGMLGDAIQALTGAGHKMFNDYSAWSNNLASKIKSTFTSNSPTKQAGLDNAKNGSFIGIQKELKSRLKSNAIK